MTADLFRKYFCSYATFISSNLPSASGYLHLAKKESVKVAIEPKETNSPSQIVVLVVRSREFVLAEEENLHPLKVYFLLKRLPQKHDAIFDTAIWPASDEGLGEIQDHNIVSGLCLKQWRIVHVKVVTQMLKGEREEHALVLNVAHHNLTKLIESQRMDDPNCAIQEGESIEVISAEEFARHRDYLGMGVGA